MDDILAASHTNGGKSTFERFEERPHESRLESVKLNFGAIQPKDEAKKSVIARTYDMSKWPHGICLIINNEKFGPRQLHPELNLDQREGTDIDEYNLVQTFTHLGYIVEVHRDCRAIEIQEIIEEIRRRDHSMYDSFVCCILSHGTDGCIYGSDSEPLLLDDITSQLHRERCQSLDTKPKLFFLQACRKQTHKPVYVATIPEVADFFFSYATPINQSAWRGCNEGSWYVSELCKYLTLHGISGNLLDIVTLVNDEVAQGYSDKGFKQEPEFNSKLGKQVFFFP